MVDKNHLLQLYSIALEEARNHDRLYTQTWVAGVVLASAASGALLYYSEEPSVVLRCSAMWVLIGVGVFVGSLFYNSIAFYGVEARNCRRKAREIGSVLAGKKQDKPPKIEQLLVTQVMRESRPLRERMALWFDPPSRSKWFFIPVGLWTYLCLSLGGIAPS